MKTMSITVPTRRAAKRAASFARAMAPQGATVSIFPATAHCGPWAVKVAGSPDQVRRGIALVREGAGALVSPKEWL